jgi:hypothetical protein
MFSGRMIYVIVPLQLAECQQLVSEAQIALAE